jgi:hypothetical protein
MLAKASELKTRKFSWTTVLVWGSASAAAKRIICAATLSGCIARRNSPNRS